MKNSIIPIVTDTNGDRSDLFSRLLKNRIIFLTGQINDELSASICAQMLLLEAQDAKVDISLYIQSPGGSLTSALAIYDTMMYIRPDVRTICIGEAASAASLILCAGAVEKRYILPNARVMIHQPLMNVGDRYEKASDLALRSEEMNRMHNSLVNIYSQHSKLQKKDLEDKLSKDTFLTAQQTVDCGFVDQIIHKSMQL
jgi:ATP-dependent Clp protease protease subunit